MIRTTDSAHRGQNDSDDPVQTVRQRLKRVAPKAGGGWQALCPAHDDHDPSLSISRGDDGRVLLHCHAGCSTEAIVAALGLQMSDLFPSRGRRTSGQGGDQPPEAVYSYQDKDRNLLFQVLRLPGKRFYQRRPDGKGGWISNLQGVRRVLYHLPELVARPNEPVFVVEGEKDADALAHRGLLATTNPGGAGKWRDAYSQSLAGRNVTILPDNDGPGQGHARQVARSLCAVGASVEVIQLPNLAEKADISDWLAAGHTVQELQSLVSDAPAWVEPDSGNGGRTPSSSDSQEPLANQLVHLLLESVYLFHDDRGKPYAAVPFPEGRRILATDSEEMKGWVSHQAWHHMRHSIGLQLLNAVQRTVGSIAKFDREEHHLSVRSAWSGDAIWLDLDGIRAVRITAEAWEIVTEPPILFRPPPHQHALPEPAHGGDPRAILDFLNISGKDAELLFLPYLVATLVPDIPIPALVIHGLPGSAKTTLLKLVKRLLDPGVVEVHGDVSNREQFTLVASQSRLFFFDNLSKIPTWLSDAMCCAVTGDGMSKRTHYSNEGLTVLNCKCVIGLASINLVANRPDLLDRSLILRMEPITPGQRRDEATLWKEFEKARPRILGGLLDILSKAMGGFPLVVLPRLPRMADFARWGAAAAQALGHTTEEFVEAFDGNVKRQHEAVLESSPVALAIIDFMQDKQQWDGSATELLKQLEQRAERQGISTRTKTWPGSVTWLQRQINEVLPTLQSMGIDFHSDRSASKRTLHLYKTGSEAVTSGAVVTDTVSEDRRNLDDDGNDNNDDKDRTSVPPPGGEQTGGNDEEVEF